MLDKARNLLISNAFRKANITSLESEPTELEIADAAHTLNVMLQAWNNDGFRLFKIKTGFLPFLPHTHEYSLATQAYKSFNLSDVKSVDMIGATAIKTANVANMAAGQDIIVVNNFVTPKNKIFSVDFKESLVWLEEPLDTTIEANDALFYGSVATAKTTLKTFNASFDTISFTEQETMPMVGDTVFIQYNDNWIQKTISSVDAVNKEITFTSAISAGRISSEILVFGASLYKSEAEISYPLLARKININPIKEIPTYISILDNDEGYNIFEVESINGDKNEIILKTAITPSVLRKLGVQYIKADIVYPAQQEMSWSDFAGLVALDEIDWGEVSDSSDLQADDWGYISDTAGTLVDWGTLTGSAKQIGFSKSNGIKYSLIYDEDEGELYLFYNAGGTWTEIDISELNLTTCGLYTALGKTFLYDIANGLYTVTPEAVVLTPVGHGVEKVVKYKDAWYFVSGKGTNITRSVTKTNDFVSFEFFDYIELDSVENPAEFKERLFIGKTDTYVGDMKTFFNADVYSENRCVIGDRLLNLNINQNCSYTLDGIKFLPMPLVLSNQSAWGYKDGCSFIAIYGVLKNGIVGTEIYTANDFNPVWTPQVFVPGKVFDVFFDEGIAYFASDVAAFSLDYRQSIKAEEKVTALCFGEQIGRPQEIMNVVKYGFENQIELPMEAVSLKSFSVLPKSGLGGSPVNYCFFRDAKDGKLLVWGTPSKFGEYLKFSYVEPITLLEDARSTPDFPDEYYEAVEDGLAAELAISYGLPLERQQTLAAKAEESKEKAMTHDNEDTSYDIMPNQRWL